MCWSLGLAALFAGCTLPQSPGDLSWDVPVYLPLGVRTYSLGELVNSQTVFLGEDSVLYYAAFAELRIPLADSLTFGPFADTLVKPPGMTDTISLRPLAGYHHRMLNATVKEGTLWLTVENISDVADTVRTVLPNLVNSRGDTLTVVWAAPPLSRRDTMIALPGYVIRLPNTTPQTVEMRLHGTAPAQIHAYVETNRISFRYYTGVLDELEIDALEGGQTVESPPEGWESVHPTRVEGVMRVVRGITGAQADVRARFSTYRSRLELASADLNADGLDLASDTSVTIPGLAHLMAVYPDSVGATGRLTLSGTVQNVQPSDTIRLELEGRAYLAFTLDPFHSPGEVGRADLSGLSDIQSGTLRLRVWNGLPVGGRVILIADSDSAHVEHGSGMAADTIADMAITAPPVSEGRPQGETYSEITVALTDRILDLFRNPPLFTRTDLRLEGSHGDTLLAHASDYIRVQPIARFVFRISTGGEE